MYARLRAGPERRRRHGRTRAWLPGLARGHDAWRADAQESSCVIHRMPLPAPAAIRNVRRQYQQPLLVLLAAVATGAGDRVRESRGAGPRAILRSPARAGRAARAGRGTRAVIRMLLAESLLLSAAGGRHRHPRRAGARRRGGAVSQPRQRPRRPICSITIDLRLHGVHGRHCHSERRHRRSAAGLARLARHAAGLARRSSRGGLPGQRASRALRVMVAGQVALSLVLVAGAVGHGAIVRRPDDGIHRRRHRSRPDRAWSAARSPGPTPARRYEVIEEIRRSLRNVPGVRQSVSGGMITPLSSSMAAAQIEVPGSIYKPPASGRRRDGDQRQATAFTPFNRVLPNYFATVGTPILMGRDFDDRDRSGLPAGRRRQPGLRDAPFRRRQSRLAARSSSPARNAGRSSAWPPTRS